MDRPPELVIWHAKGVRPVVVSCGHDRAVYYSQTLRLTARRVKPARGPTPLFDVLVDIEDCLSTRKHNHVSSLYKNSKALGGNVLPEHTLSVSQNELEESETHNFQF